MSIDRSYKSDSAGNKLNLRIAKLLSYLFSVLILLSCTFDYGNEDKGENNLPDIVMEDVEYVRVRSRDPQARFVAERLERYEERRVIDLLNFSFEQFGNHGEDVNAFGNAGSGSVEIDSGDIRLNNTVRIEIESEDIVIETEWLEWKDNPRILSGGEEDEVIIQQQNGTIFIGLGFRADARQRTWEFSGLVEGIFIHEDKDEEPEKTGNSPEGTSDEETLTPLSVPEAANTGGLE